MLRIKLVKSTIGHNPRNRATVQALGLKRVRQVVEHADTPTIRGMIRHVHPLLSVEVVPDTAETAGKRSISGKESRAAQGNKSSVEAKAEKPVAKAKAAPAKVAAAKAAPAKKAAAKAEKPAEAKPKAKPATKAKKSEETK